MSPRQTSAMPVVRCAIYTRKSTEEGLEQAFNSLDAQRESAMTYITHRRHLGWEALPEIYDDGGFSGGSLERPALQRLFDDIVLGKIDCVVVYKVDRISRSLIDFARLMALFEQHRVTFISVTQDFDTSTPMGRLTLNILFSFSQFEREIISERTRDKMAATRKKGMFIGGNPTYGYDIDPVSHQLVINESEAAVVREIYTLYRELRSPRGVMQVINDKGYRTKSYTSRRGREHPAHPWCQYFIRRILTNPIYIGEVTYKGTRYPGVHPAIIPMELWEQVQAILQTGKRAADRTRTPAYQTLLTGILICGACGCALSPSCCRKPQKVYRYYRCMNAQRLATSTCPLRQVPQGDVDTAVITQVRALFRTPEELIRRYREDHPGDETRLQQLYTALFTLNQLEHTWETLYPATQRQLIRTVVQQVRLSPDALEIDIAWDGILTMASQAPQGLRR